MNFQEAASHRRGGYLPEPPAPPEAVVPPLVPGEIEPPPELPPPVRAPVLPDELMPLLDEP